MKKVSIIIPCLNEDEVMHLLFDRVNSVLDTWEYTAEVICVDDGSIDRTWSLISQFSAKDSRWKGLSLSRNFGHQPAVTAGMTHADGDCVVIIDADLQDPPEVISQFLEEWENGSEVVYGVRKKREDHGIKKFLAWGFYRVLARLSTVDIPTDSGDFCLLDQKVVKVMNRLPERNRYLRGLRVWCGFKHKALEYERDGREAGEPQYTFKKSLKLALDGLFSFSAVPLSVASHAGLWISLTAFLGALFTLLQRLFPDFFDKFGMAPAPGFATIVISVLFLGGVQLICLGILGEYLSRIYEEVKGRPSYIVSQTVNTESEKQSDA